MTGNIPIPKNEKQRLEALSRYNIMDTLPEQEFDDITKLASYICDVPIAHVSFLDERRQWFKSKIGMDVPEMPRDQTFCQYTIMQPDMVYIPDASKDAFFKDHEHVKGDFHVRFYAGVPLTTPDGLNIGTICVVDTEPKEISEEQKAALSTLAKHVITQMELRLTNLDLIQAKDIAEKAVFARDAFLGNMSHEIRTPINAIVGFTYLLAQTDLTREQLEFVTNVETAGGNLLTLVNDILDLSKIESGKLVIEAVPFNLKDTLKHVYDLLNHKASKNNIQVKLVMDDDIPDYVAGDKLRINQVLMNLTGNAIKFTEEGEVVIAADKISETETAYTIRFSVKDTGIGIAADNLDSIFDRFVQAEDSTSRRFGGTGLGLSIVKQLVDLMNGKIEVKSIPGKGSEFIVTLDFYKAGQPVEKPSVPGTISGDDKKLSILLCEDNELNQNLAERIIHNFGFEVTIANNGEEGIELLKQNDFDLVLMDIQMPVKDGYQTTTFIREEMGLAIPIIALTAHSLIGEQKKCISYGMDAYISKPFRPAELLEKIRSVIKNN